jgi:hypothetical protein
MITRLASRLRHPLWIILIPIGLGLWLKENYPLSNFPMYSLQRGESDYYYLQDAEGRPLATQQVSSLSSTKIKKMMAKELKALAKKKRCKVEELSLPDHQTLGAAMLQRLRAGGLWQPGSPTREPYAAPITLVWVNLMLGENGHIQKTPQPLAVSPAPSL